MTVENRTPEVREVTTTTGQRLPSTMAPPMPSVFSDAATFEHAQRMANALCTSDMVPPQYRGRENMANCLILLDVSRRMGLPPLLVAVSLNIIHGRPTWSSQFVISAINSAKDSEGRNLFTPLRFEWEGAANTDAWGCRATARDQSGETLRGSLITIGLAKREGWYARQGSKWQTMPEQMLMYRAGAFFGKIYAGHILNGMGTTEEAQDAPRDVTAAGSAEVVAPDAAAVPAAPIAALNERVARRRRERATPDTMAGNEAGVVVVDEVVAAIPADEVAAVAERAMSSPRRGADSVEDIF